MRYRKLTLTNFGAFYGRQEFTFGRERGVWIVYGRNSRGKTTLLNAFRFALYGEYLGRTAPRRLEEVTNELHVQEVGAADEPGFQVELAFEHKGSEYELSRAFKAGVSTMQMRKDGVTLPLDASERELRTVAPPSISRFYLFDGELLRQYEELSDEKTDSARRLREEVNRILGVTSILRTAEHLREIHAEESRDLARSAAAQSKSKRAGTLLQEIQSKRSELVEEKRSTEAALAQERQRLEEVEDALSVQAQAREIMGQLERCKQQKTATQVELVRGRELLTEVAAGAWKAVVAAGTADRIDALEEEAGAIELERIQAYARRHAALRLQHSEECPTCAQTLDEHTRAVALQRAKEGSDEAVVEHLDAEAERVDRRLRLLRRMAQESNAAIIADRERAVAGLKLKLSQLEAEARGYEEELAEVDQSEVKRLQSERDQLLQLVTRDQEFVTDLETQIEEQDTQAAKIRKEITATGVEIEPALEQRERIAERLGELYSASVKTYQEAVLREVETSATKLFLRMRSEEDFAGLSVTDGYGVTILDRSGHEVKGHSAGYQHLIALSLIGALQRSSPVQGPIVMDSPFGRLDEVHTRQVVAALPEVADQVLLLAFEGEFDRGAAVEELGTTLVAEHRLEHVSSKHTKLEPREVD